MESLFLQGCSIRTSWLCQHSSDVGSSLLTLLSDAHRLTWLLVLSPVNCPFLAKFHSPDNYNGTMRTDANSAGKPVYFPNSYHTTQNSSMSKKTTPGFDPSKTEAPYQVANNVVSRQSQYLHEGDPSEYTQVRDLYKVSACCIVSRGRLTAPCV